MPYITLYSAIILLAANALFSKSIPLDAITITQVRSCIANFALALFLLVIKKGIRIGGWKKQRGIYLLGILMGLHWVTYFHAMQVSSVAVGMLSLYTFPVIIVFMEAAINKRKPRISDVISAVVILIGIFILSGGNFNFSSSNTLEGIVSGLASAIFFSSRNLIQKYRFADVGSEHLMFYQVIAIAVIFLPFMDYQGVFTLAPVDWLQFLMMGVFTTACAHTFLVLSYKNFSAKTVAMISCLQPVLGALFAWIILGEIITVPVIIGGSIILSIALYETVLHSKKAV